LVRQGKTFLDMLCFKVTTDMHKDRQKVLLSGLWGSIAALVVTPLLLLLLLLLL
jgi:hypothetical protein